MAKCCLVSSPPKKLGKLCLSIRLCLQVGATGTSLLGSWGGRWVLHCLGLMHPWGSFQALWVSPAGAPAADNTLLQITPCCR